MFTINYKAKETKDPEIVKVEMIFYRPGYARLSRILNISGLKSDWVENTQMFKETTSQNIEKNRFLRDERLRFTKIAEEWEAESTEFSPKQWADYFKTTQPKKQLVKIITISDMLDEIIDRKKTKKRLINNFEVTSTSTGKKYNALKFRLNEFTKAKYGKALSNYYFLTSSLIFV
jgi:hypothetical protein